MSDIGRLLFAAIEYADDARTLIDALETNIITTKASEYIDECIEILNEIEGHYEV